MQTLVPVMTAVLQSNQMSGQSGAASQPGTVTSDRRSQRSKRKPGALSQYGAETTVLTGGSDKLGA